VKPAKPGIHVGVSILDLPGGVSRYWKYPDGIGGLTWFLFFSSVGDGFFAAVSNPLWQER
jgi:hypothetical protein